MSIMSHTRAIQRVLSNAFSFLLLFYKFWVTSYTDYFQQQNVNSYSGLHYYALDVEDPLTNIRINKQQQFIQLLCKMRSIKIRYNPKSIIPIPTTKQSYQRLYAKEK
ncbi:hypothetical protein ACJW30_03G007000 [Castanea mollissima]